MFKSFRKRLKGVVPYDTLAAESKAIFFNCVQNESMLATQSCWRVASQKPEESFHTWFNGFKDTLAEIADAEDQFSQIIAIRKEIVECTKASISALAYLDDKFTEEDQTIIGNMLMPTADDASDREMQQYQLYADSDITVSILRWISANHFKDAKRNDWFDLFSDSYRNLIESTFKRLIAQEKDEIDPMSPLVQVQSQLVEQIETQIYEGMNWDYDKEQIEAERAEEDRQREQEEDAKKKPKQKVVSNSQIDDLSEYLLERTGRLMKGELYTAPWEEGERIHPQSPGNAVLIDLGLMLIAMTECVDDDDTAETAVRKAAIKVIKKYDSDAELDTFNMEIPVLFREQFREHEDDGWLAHLLPAFAKLLYGDLLDTIELHDIFEKKGEVSDSEQEVLDEMDKGFSRLAGKIAFELMDDLLEVGHYTKQVFGWDVGEYHGFLRGD